MKVTYSWLNDFVEIKLPPKELADTLTMAGLEVVSLEEKGGDCVFEIEVTSNRPDWLSVLGIAREVAAITHSRLKVPRAMRQAKFVKASLKIEIEDRKDCPLYIAGIVKNIKVGPAPEWLRKRLELVGCRSVNNIVDITNYVLFELGEPLHAFDLDKLAPEKIIVRRGKAGEKILTLDEQEKSLASENLVIADKDKAVAIAGVMGGKETEVTSQTKNILLEAAVFNPVVIRRSRQRIGLQSEASYRFERGIDLEIVQRAALRAVELIKEYGSAGEACFASSSLTKSKAIRVRLDTAYAGQVLGVNLAPATIKKILTGLGFKPQSKSKGVFMVGIPSFRQDVNAQIDLIEEVARVFGYERIPASLPVVKPDISIKTKRELVAKIKNILTGLGVNEAITYSLTDKDGLNSLGPEFAAKAIEIMNPLSREQEVLRTTLMLGLGRAVAFNLNQKQDYVAIFEIANLFRAGEKPQEELGLAIALSGTKTFLSSQGLIKDEASLLHLKGILETIFNSLGIASYAFTNQGEVYIEGEKIGVMLCLRPQALKALEVKNRDVLLAEVTLDKLLSFARLNKKFMSLPKYPGIIRDISVILKKDLSTRDILARLKEKGGVLLRQAQVTDYYQGKQIPAGYRGLTLSCLYGSNDRTLTDAEVQPVHNLICQMLTSEFGATLR